MGNRKLRTVSPTILKLEDETRREDAQRLEALTVYLGNWPVVTFVEALKDARFV